MVATAIIGGAVVGAGASMAAGSMQASAAEDAAGLQADATRASVAEQRRQFDLTREDLAPYREVGTAALQELSDLFMPGDPLDDPDVLSKIPAYRKGIVHQKNLVKQATPGSDEYWEGRAALDRWREGVEDLGVVPSQTDKLRETPGYQFRFDEGMRALDRSASARGRLQGGGYGRELQRYGQGLASMEFESYANRLASLAGVGQSATTAGAQLGAQTAGNISNTLMAGAQGQGNALMNAGTARASGYAGAANAATGAAQNWMIHNALQG